MHVPFTPQFPIRRSWILSILLIIPAVAVFGLWDIYGNDGALQPALRYDSLFLPLYLLVFELPHVIASFFGFFQGEYVRHYRKHLFVFLPVVLVAFGLLAGINFYTAFLLYLVVTLFHVIRQQTGIALFFGVPKNRWHGWWTWSLIAGLASMYIIMQPGFLEDSVQTTLLWVTQAALLVALWLTVKVAQQTKTALGVWYVLATFAMALVSFAMLISGYEFLSVLVVRVIHDVTAFLFYVTHEMNSNAVAVKNYLYRFLPGLPWSLVVIIPLLAVTLGLTLRSVIADPTILLGIVMTVSVAHYYLESIIWKRENPHRHHISIT